MTDWLATLKEQGELATNTGRKVAEALGHPDLTLDQARRIYGVVEKSAQAFDRMVSDMEDDDVDESLLEAAESIEDIWAAVSIAAANKVRTMQGLDPIEIDDDIDDEDDD